MVTVNKISPEEITLCEDGCWSHSMFPAWDETASVKEIDSWFTWAEGEAEIKHLESDNSELFDLYCEGFTDLSAWNPKGSFYDSFLLSIHDTDNGPVAIFFSHCAYCEEKKNKDEAILSAPIDLIDPHHVSGAVFEQSIINCINRFKGNYPGVVSGLTMGKWNSCIIEMMNHAGPVAFYARKCLENK